LGVLAKAMLSPNHNSHPICGQEIKSKDCKQYRVKEKEEEKMERGLKRLGSISILYVLMVNCCV
jgi:hypothetical protein